MKNSVQQRVMTGILLLIGATFALGFNYYSYIILFGAVCGFCLWEFLTITLPKADAKYFRNYRILGLLIGILPFVLVSIPHLVDFPISWLLIGKISLLVLFGLFVLVLFTKTPKPFSYISNLLVGLVYLGVPFALLIPIREQYSTVPIIGMWVFTAAFDVAAFFVGRQIGKTPLFPRISPKKTWEGVAGGAALMVIALMFILPFLLDFLNDYTSFQSSDNIDSINWWIVAAIAIVFGTLGDLVESMLKRSFNIKDSGTLLPGHGGFLDRFDSFYFPLPFLAIYLLG